MNSIPPITTTTEKDHDKCSNQQIKQVATRMHALLKRRIFCPVKCRKCERIGKNTQSIEINNRP
jgi:hypothetical protein